MSDEPLLAVRDLDVFYGDARALHRVSLDIREGEVVSVVGANGAGKTTLIRTIAGMKRPTAGEIRFLGQSIQGRRSHEVGELGIAQVAEGRQVFPTLTVQENLELGAVLPRARHAKSAGLERIYTMFRRLKERRDQMAGTLSGGEQQMLAIGRCLMGQPRLIMFDEPSLGLAPQLVLEVFDIIRELNRTGITILLVEQNVAESLELCDRAYVVESGEITLSGDGKSLLDDDRVREAYLGL